MQLKNPVEVDVDNGIPIYSSLESLLQIPASMSRELSEKALKTQEVLEKWSLNRRKVARNMEDCAEELEKWEKGCAISTTVGSSVGVASGFAVIGGLIVMPPVAIAGLIVGTVAGASNLITGIAKHQFWKSKIAEVGEMLERDEELFGKLLESRQELMEFIKKVIDSEEFHKNFETKIDMENRIKSILGGSALGTSGLAARYAMVSMGRLTSSLVKGILHSAAVIGIVLDSVTLALSAKDLMNGTPSELGQKFLALSGKMELDRQKVCKHILDHDVWNADEEDDDGMRTLETLSDTGSMEIIRSGESAHEH